LNSLLVSASPPLYRKFARQIRSTLETTLRFLRLSNVEVSVLLTSDREITRMNRKYRGKNRPTDVLSFAQEEGRFLGDIVISVPTARRQAKAAGHPFERECALLAVHGFLHLLGHDHADPAEARRMFALQERILRKAAPDA
jgi:probable rRNA maturation factor